MPRFRTGKRRERRLKLVAPVRLCIVKNGNQQWHLAHTLDVSDHGVRLGGVHCDLKSDDAFELQYHHKRARFRVVWVTVLEGSQEKHIGAESMESQKDVWNVEIPQKADEYEEKD
jgi:hypothetical protein